MDKKAFKKKLIKRNKKRWLFPVILSGLILLLVGIYYLPPIHERLAWRVASFRSNIIYFFNPPEEAVFNPQQQSEMEIMLTATVTAWQPTSTLSPSKTPTQFLTPTYTATLVPTITPTPLPSSAQLSGVVHEYQKFNNCGPANLSMALSYWGWTGNQLTIASVLKPSQKDRNVMPYEMQDFINSQTAFSSVLRYGGDVDTLRAFIAAGFPVIIERGFDVQGKGWMGHYGVVTGFDDSAQKFQIPDSYEGPRTMSYGELEQYWGHFSGIYLVIYPPDREGEVMDILGPDADSGVNLLSSADKASLRTYTEVDRELFFAWFSRGTILAELADYYGAAQAYDRAFQVYGELSKSERPWRITWYQTGPYFAYYYTGRYYDVINLADQTLSGQQLFGFDVEPAFEETWVWRGRAKLMLGDTSGAIADFQEALKWHPSWWVAEQELISLGITP